MAKVNLLRLMKAKGRTKKVVKIKPSKVPYSIVLELQAIALDMVRFIYGFTPELMQAYRDADLEPGGTIFDAPDDIDRILQMIVGETSTVMNKLFVKVQSWGWKGEERHRKGFVSAVQAGTGINLETVLAPHDMTQTVGAAVTRATNLIRDLGDEGRKRVGDIVLQGVQQRIPPDVLGRQIAESLEMSERRAKNIAADQSNKLNASLDRARQQEVGMPGFIWRHSGKAHPREEHLARDGEFYLWDTDDIEPGDFPGEPPFCGCIAQGVLVDEAGDVLEEFEGEELDLEDWMRAA